LAVVLARFGPPAPRDRRVTADRAIERAFVAGRFAVGRVLTERALDLGFDLVFDLAVFDGRTAARTAVFFLVLDGLRTRLDAAAFERAFATLALAGGLDALVRGSGGLAIERPFSKTTA